MTPKAVNKLTESQKDALIEINSIIGEAQKLTSPCKRAIKANTATVKIRALKQTKLDADTHTYLNDLLEICTELIGRATSGIA